MTQSHRVVGHYDIAMDFAVDDSGMTAGGGHDGNFLSVANNFLRPTGDFVIVPASGADKRDRVNI